MTGPSRRENPAGNVRCDGFTQWRPLLTFRQTLATLLSSLLTKGFSLYTQNVNTKVGGGQGSGGGSDSYPSLCNKQEGGRRLGRGVSEARERTLTDILIKPSAPCTPHHHSPFVFLTVSLPSHHPPHTPADDGALSSSLPPSISFSLSLSTPLYSVAFDLDLSLSVSSLPLVSFTIGPHHNPPPSHSFHICRLFTLLHLIYLLCGLVPTIITAHFVLLTTVSYTV